MSSKVSYAQNGEDIRVWRAFRRWATEGSDPLFFVEVGANEPRHLSVSASLSELGWRGLLIEADPDLAEELRRLRPTDTVVECAASSSEGELAFHAIPGTGLGTLDSNQASAAENRGFSSRVLSVRARTLDSILGEHRPHQPIHFMTIDVEGGEASVLEGLDLTRFRPWVMCIEAIEPGTDTPSHHSWEPMLVNAGYRFVAFDGVNRWYVAQEHEDLSDELAVPFNALDAGRDGWIIADHYETMNHLERERARHAWQREIILNDARISVPVHEYEKQIIELRTALGLVEASRSWRYSRRVGSLVRRVTGRARALLSSLPMPLQRQLVRARHLRHVRVNFPQLTDAAFLDRAAISGRPIAQLLDADIQSLPQQASSLEPLTHHDALTISSWLDACAYDDDATLMQRMDNRDDRIGRVRSAMRERLDLQGGVDGEHGARGSKVLVDARSLQSRAFSTRGIGRFASSAVLGLRAALGDERIDLLVDPGLEPLPPEIRGSASQVTKVTDATQQQYSSLIQPSPMTAPASPLLPLLRSDARKVAIVYDFIPMHFPSVYLADVAARAEYAASLDALRRYDEFVCISHTVCDELKGVLRGDRGRSGPPLKTTVAWPRALEGEANSAETTAGGVLVIMSGDEPRKNTYGALAAIGAATAGQDEARDVLVVGMAGQSVKVHHWSIHAAMREGEARAAERMSEEELQETLRSARLVMIPSFDEGLSLPVIEAVQAGANVLASDIPAHRELLGRGSFLFDPRDVKRAVRKVRRASRRRSNAATLQRRLARHRHEILEDVLVRSVPTPSETSLMALPPAAVHLAPSALRLALATPWTPQPTGVADYSATIGRALSELCDLTVYSTAGAEAMSGIRFRPVDELLASPASIERGHDAIVSVIGNSHFHIPFVEALRHVDAVAVLHDTRMVEYYLALRGPGGLEDLMLRGQPNRALRPSLEDQIGDMRLLQNAGLWEVARRARAVVLHAPSAAQIVESQTGVPVEVLPFATQRVPAEHVITREDRQRARARLGWDPDRIYMTSFGYVDIRTKLSDLVVEAGAWLAQWGHNVEVRLAGAAQPELVRELTDQAARAQVRLVITGFLNEEDFRDHLLASDVGVQLRVSPLLGVSGPLSDLSAWGTPAVASEGLAMDVGAPSYIHRVPESSSALQIAEALEERLGAAPEGSDSREQQRRAYLAEKSPVVYAERLLALAMGTR